jgi:Trehalose utilisation
MRVCFLLLGWLTLLGTISAQEKKPRIALISGSLEYSSDESLTKLQATWEKQFAVECVRMSRRTDTDIPGLEKLPECDVAVFFTRRLKPTPEQLEGVKKYLASGKPVIGLRTASHGFQNYLEMDREIFGGDYKNHTKAGPLCEIIIEEKSADDAILRGVKPFQSVGTLYKNAKVAEDVWVLLRGTVGSETYPVAWTRERNVMNQKQRIFYTSLGHTADFEKPEFQRLLGQALTWAAPDVLPKP